MKKFSEILYDLARETEKKENANSITTEDFVLLRRAVWQMIDKNRKLGISDIDDRSEPWWQLHYKLERLSL